MNGSPLTDHEAYRLGDPAVFTIDFESSFNPSPDLHPSDLSLNVFQNEVMNNANKTSAFNIHDDEITADTIIKEIVPVITIGGSTFAAQGDISIVGGLPKAGKTSISVHMIATALMKEIGTLDTLQIQSTFCNGKKVIYIDTEQPTAYTNKLRRAVLKLLGVDKQPENLHIVNLRKYSSEEKWKRIQAWMKAYPETHLWIIDGVADLIRDPNDTKEAFGIIQQLMMASDRLNTAIVLYLHENPGNTGKLRGNLGSEAERKCGGVIAVKKLKDKGVHCIEAKLIRGSADFDPIFFRWDNQAGRMVSLDPLESAEMKKTIDKGEIKRQKLIALAKACLIAGGLRAKDLVQCLINNAAILEHKSFGKRTAETRIREMLDMSIVVKEDDIYRLADEYLPKP